MDSGRLGMAPAKRAMLARTAVQQEPGEVLEPRRARDQAPQPTCTPQGKTLVVRLDGTSQINIEEQAPWILDMHPDVIFQDYLGATSRLDPSQPLRRVVGTERDTEVTIRNRGNVVFPVNVPKGEPLPKTFMGRTVIDGDKHDLRFLDHYNNILGPGAVSSA